MKGNDNFDYVVLSTTTVLDVRKMAFDMLMYYFLNKFQKQAILFLKNLIYFSLNCL